MSTDFDTEFTKTAPGRTKSSEPIVRETSSKDEMSFVNMYPSYKLRELSVFIDEASEASFMAICRTELFRLDDEHFVGPVL